MQIIFIMLVAMRNVGMYMFDEPSCFLDVKQRIKAAKVIRCLINSDKYILVVDHDLSTLDYLSDIVCCL
jgi:ATP-binding cassette subfamily E protein 1